MKLHKHIENIHFRNIEDNTCVGLNFNSFLPSFLHAWDKFMRYWEQCGKPTKGRVFPISYKLMRENFHATRKRASQMNPKIQRIGEDLETLVPHIFRKTHAQWCKRIGVTLENLCGDTTESPCIGRYGVGWDDPKVPMKYYLTREAWEYAEQDLKIQHTLQRLRFVDSPSMQMPDMGLSRLELSRQVRG